ncbi:MAG: helix-turn-helix domain-containing protein [Acidobacteriota bacterium]
MEERDNRSGSVHFRRSAPPPRHGDVVRFLYRLSSPGGSQALPNHPQGAVDLLFVTKGRASFQKDGQQVSAEAGGTLLVPLQTRPFQFVFAPGTDVLGITLEPVGSRELLGRPPGDADSCHLLTERSHPRLGVLRRQLDRDTSLGTLERWLMQERRSTAEGPDLATLLDELGLRAATRLTAGDLASELGLSTRSLQRMFRTELGLSPRTALRLARFQHALKLLRAGGRTKLADTALAAGYFDQAHFANEFRAFAGLSPTRFLERKEPLVEAFAESTGG